MSNDTPKIPVSMPDLPWASKNDAQLMAMHTAAVGNTGGSPKSSATMTGGKGGYDGTTDPGPAGDPV